MRRTMLAVPILALGALASAAAQQPFKHELVSMIVPAGWTVQPRPADAEAEFVASIQASVKTATAVITAGNYGKIDAALQRGRGMILAALPGAVPDTVVHDFKIENGDRMLLQGFTATVTYGGKDVEVGAILAVTVNGRRGVIAQFYFPPDGSPVGTEFGQLIRTFK